jgi:hypothetical protein
MQFGAIPVLTMSLVKTDLFFFHSDTDPVQPQGGLFKKNLGGNECNTRTLATNPRMVLTESR